MERTGLQNTNPASIVNDRYQICPSCGSFIRYTERVSFCILCGTRLLNECPQCHEHIMFPTGRYCPACGTALVVGRD